MRIRRVFRYVSTFVSGLAGAMVKAVVTSVVMGALVVSYMYYMSVPVPDIHDLIGGLSELAEVLS